METDMHQTVLPCQGVSNIFTWITHQYNLYSPTTLHIFSSQTLNTISENCWIPYIKEHLRHCVTILSARCLCLVQILGAVSFRSVQASNERAELGRVADVSAVVCVVATHSLRVLPATQKKIMYCLIMKLNLYWNFEINQSKSVSLLKKWASYVTASDGCSVPQSSRMPKQKKKNHSHMQMPQRQLKNVRQKKKLAL